MGQAAGYKLRSNEPPPEERRVAAENARAVAEKARATAEEGLTPN